MLYRSDANKTPNSSFPTFISIQNCHLHHPDDDDDEPDVSLHESGLTERCLRVNQLFGLQPEPSLTHGLLCPALPSSPRPDQTMRMMRTMRTMKTMKTMRTMKTMKTMD